MGEAAGGLMPPTPNNFAQIPASARIRAALLELQGEYLRSIDKTESEMGKILARSAARQADLIIQNLTAFEARGTHIFATSRNLGLLEDLTTALAQLDVPARDSAQQAWTEQALELRRVLTKAAPELGIDMARTDFARASLQMVQVASQNAFSELSDFAQLQRGTIINLKTEVADLLARGLDYRSIAGQVRGTGITALDAIPGVRRAFSLEERAESIGRTETVRVQTQLQDVLGEEAGLDWGRSYLNWALSSHHELCLWAEAMGWAPVPDFLDGPGLPSRHTRCGCHWQRGLKDWVDPEEGPEAMSKDFAQRLLADEIRISAELFSRLPPIVQAKVQRQVKAPGGKKLQLPKAPKPFDPLSSVPKLPTKPKAAPAAPEPAPAKPEVQLPALDLEGLKKLDLHGSEPTWALPPLTPWKSVGYGAIVVDGQGRVLVKKTADHGQLTTSKKISSLEHPASLIDAEGLPKYGMELSITGLVPGAFSIGKGKNFFFLTKPSTAEAPAGSVWLEPGAAIEALRSNPDQKLGKMYAQALQAALKQQARLARKSALTVTELEPQATAEEAPGPQSPPRSATPSKSILRQLGIDASHVTTLEPLAPAGPTKPRIREIDPDALQLVDLHAAEPTWSNPGSSRAYGGVMFDNRGRVLLREPSGHYDGYHWTFAKGKAKAGDHPVKAALRETLEETGHDGAVVGLVPGAFSSGSASKAFYFLMRSKGHDPAKMDAETSSTKWATLEEAKELIGQSTNAGGKARDLQILEAAHKAWTELQQGQQVASLAGVPTLTKAQVLQKAEAKKAAEKAAAEAAAAAAEEAKKKAEELAKEQKKAAAKQKRDAKKAAAEAQKRLEVLRAAEVNVEQDVSPLPAAEDFPADPLVLDLVRLLGGSTGAELVRDRATGKQYVRKRGASPEHLREEATADLAYQALGVRVPTFRLYETAEGPVKLAEFIEGQILSSVLEDPTRAPKVLERLQRHFAADALLGNWDVAGLSLDNILVDQAGLPVRIDNGGALRRRAMGSAKTAAEWNEHPEELWTLRDPRTNAQTARIFSGLGFFDLAAQMRDLQRYRERLSRALPEDLRPTVLGRLASMQHVGRIAGKLETDAWSAEYVDQFARHLVGLRKAGLVDAMPAQLNSKLERSRANRLGFKEYGTRDVKDETGKSWDALRGAGSIMKALETYVKKAGGSWDAVTEYLGAQAGSSWSNNAQAAKYFLATKARALPETAYFWRYGIDKAKTKYKAATETRGESVYTASMAAAHAFTFELLSKAAFPNKAPEGDAAILVRTEDAAVMTHYGMLPGTQDATMPRGAMESGSIFQRVIVHGTETTLQRVPLWRIFWTYFTSQAAGQHKDSLLGDGENEFVFIPEGLPFDYETWG